MEVLASLDDISQHIAMNEMACVYFSRPDCSVCSALKPSVDRIMADYPEIRPAEVDLDCVPEAAGAYSIFAIPGLLLFVDGREAIREARFVHTEELRSNIDRLYRLCYAGAIV